MNVRKFRRLVLGMALTLLGGISIGFISNLHLSFWWMIFPASFYLVGYILITSTIHR